MGRKTKRTIDPKGKVSIYGMIDPDEGKVVYVGSSRNLKGRLSVHNIEANSSFQKARKNKNPLYVWFRRVLESGKTPELHPLEECTEENRNEREEWWIAYLRSINTKLFNRRWVGTKSRY